MAEEEEAEEEEEEEDDVFYAPSFVDRRKRHKKNTGFDDEEEEEALNTKDVFGGTSSSSSDDDDEKEEEEEEETKKDARTRRKQREEEEEAGVVVSESESESDQSFPRKAALKNTCNNVSRRERTTRAGAVDEKTREATALMRELTKRTDAKILDEDEDEEEIAEKDEKGNNDDDDDDDDDILSHYEPITLVFALSNTNKLELETCATFTFKRIWTDFVSMHVLEGNAEKARLNFDGDVIKFDEDTPKSLGMENDDCVDVIM